MNKVEYLIISSTLDFSTDYVCVEMMKRHLNYLRINRDRFSEYTLEYKNHSLIVVIDEQKYLVSKDTVRSVLFRSPVFIRSNKTYPLDKQLYRTQWSSFVRNLTVFSDAKWLNHPMFTYQAENKIYQLDVANSVGLKTPETVITNDSSNLVDDRVYVVKALDTPLFYEAGQEMFTYTTVATGAEIKASSLKNAPVIIQEYLEKKVDLRVTVVGNEIFPAKITKDGQGIFGDWRKTRKEELQYNRTSIPYDVEEKILCLMKKLNISFGGVDLILNNGEYYFIEVNPTGEWGWIEAAVGYDIHGTIVNWMEGKYDQNI